MEQPYAVRFSVDYPDRDLDRLSTLLRIIWVIPIAIVLGSVSGGASQSHNLNGQETSGAAAGGLLFLAPLLMIVFRRKYPRWWFDWNRELLRFGARVGAYLALMDDRYPSTDEEQSVHLDIDYPNMPDGLSQWMPLVKWLLAVPHLIVLVFLWLFAFVAVIVAWFAVLLTGRYPRGLFDFVVGVMRWTYRVIGYAFVLVTDRYPPFNAA
ncbi:MAG: DUF4389 domain-containing protein [Chloroflexota bacterium]|nr:DUF4389 domain-containing protein [Chloroflexota bacterium]